LTAPDEGFPAASGCFIMQHLFLVSVEIRNSLAAPELCVSESQKNVDHAKNGHLSLFDLTLFGVFNK